MSEPDVELATQILEALEPDVELAIQILEALGVEADSVVTLDLHFEAGCWPEATIVMHIIDQDTSQLVEQISRYQLTPRKPLNHQENQP